VSVSRAASVADFRQLAKMKLPKLLFDYADGGSYAERTPEHNVEDWLFGNASAKMSNWPQSSRFISRSLALQAGPSVVFAPKAAL